MNAYLVSPVCLYELGMMSARGSGPDKIFLFALPASILWLLAIQLLVRRLWIVHAVLFPLYLIVGVDLFLISHYHTRLTSSMITVILENWSDAPDYLRDNRIPIIRGLLPIIVLYLGGLFKIRKLVLRGSKRQLLAAVVALAALYSAVTVRQMKATGWRLGAGVLDVVSHDRNSPFGVFPQGYVAYQVYRDAAEHRRAAASFVFGARRVRTPADPELFVLVLGESSRPDHWGLYGYPRDTTPRLASEPDLVVFRDVVTQAALTQLAVPLILTRSSIDDWHKHLSEASIVTTFKEVGFATYWFSNQQQDQYTGAVNRYSAEADHVRFLDRQYDGSLIKQLKEALQTGKNAEGKLFVVLHTQGSHWVYDDRCPKDFRVFPAGGAGLSDRQRLVNAYDNSIVYTDVILSELIALLRPRRGITALLYVADHGENLKDDGRELLGHFFNNEYDLPVPMLLWYSEEFKSRFPDKVWAVKRNAGQRINTRAVFFTLADMADIVFSDSQRPALSLFNPSWTGVPRLVLLRWEETVDFDEWVRAKNLRLPLSQQLVRTPKP